MASSKPDTGEDVESILKVFRTFDMNGDGFINFSELSIVMKRLDDMWTEPKLRRILREADANHDDKIDYEELVMYLTTGTASNWCKATILEVGQLQKELKLSLADAEKMLRARRPRDWKTLASSTDKTEQLVMRVALVYVGHEDPTWENATSALADPFEFLKAALDTETGQKLTVQRVRLADGLGIIHMRNLDQGSTAWVLAQYLTACLAAAKDRLGIVDGNEGTHLPKENASKSKKWPIKIQMKELPKSLLEAAQYQKTPLLICNGMESNIDQYFRYRGYLRIDAKRILAETSFLRNPKGIEEVREEVRQVVVAAMKANMPLHIRMGSTAVALRDTFCADGSFPKALFNPLLWNDRRTSEQHREYLKILTPSDLEDLDSWQRGPGNNLLTDFFVVVTSDFDKEAAIEHLPPALPHLSEMAIIEIDPPIGGSWSWGGDEAERAAKFGAEE